MGRAVLGHGIFDFDPGDERLQQVATADTPLLGHGQRRGQYRDRPVHDAGVTGVIEVVGMAGTGVDQRGTHRMQRPGLTDDRGRTGSISRQCITTR